ncbi:hypothetical protein [Candidatus Cyanaurora vandensis]|uniref:hypothetical protein n=1 Tax=Candidatus Cyanaurora vandensis TaxID=2714958 RepID=UPI00257E35DF|nr:hypothetical protein [Candidatus Cyanaurora vandensis]
MAQVCFYLPDEEQQRLLQRATAQGLSLSKYMAQLVRREMKTGWPEGYFQHVLGSWQGDLERPPQGDYEVREEL